MNSRANSTDWYNLYQTIYHTIVINDISAPYKGFLAILNELSNTVTQDLIGLGNAIENALDFRDRSRNSRPTIRFGLDEELDAKKLRQQDISKDVIAAARLAVDSLPQFLEECSVIYLPEMGYLIGINKWDENCYPEELEKLGFSFVFTLKDMFLYKNPLCAELDRRLGDITGEIIDHENRIVRRLAGFICKHNRDIRDPLKTIGLIDCLISIAKVSLNNSFVRPKLNTESIFEISGSRHPLMEQLISQYQPNDFFSGGPYSRMKIITGPNGSGKSIYLKQVALITFLAHTGSYVPAEKANIGLIGSFYSRLMATESASIRLSSFMIDITQMTRALNANSNSLILLDEFGRGTTEEDGMSILGGVLKYFLNSEKGCPHILVSTHFQQMITYLPETPLIECQQMTYTKEDGGIYFLYKLAKGISKSYALDVAESIGLDKDLIARAREILDCLQNNRQIEPLPEFKAKLDLIEHLTHLEIPEQGMETSE